MIGKFSIFFLLAFVSVQGTQARIVSSYQYEQTVLSFWDVVKEIIENIKEALGDLPGKIKEIIQKLQDKIKEIVGDLNIEEIVENIKEKIMEIIGNASEVVRKCVDEQMPAINQVAQETQVASQQCVQTAQSSIMGIQERVNELVARAQALKDEIVNSAIECVKNNALNPPGMIDCFQGLLPEVMSKINELKNVVVDFIQNAKNDVETAAIELANCMNAVSEQASQKETEIINNIQQCISSS